MMDQQEPVPDHMPQLPYATRFELSDLMRAYCLVGWYYLLTAIVATVSAVGYLLTLSMQMRSGMVPSLLLSLLTSWGPQVLLAAGAVGMIRGRSWGAWAIIGLSGLRVLLAGAGIAYQLLLVNRASSPGSGFVMYSGVNAVLSSAVSAFLPWVFWRLCRSRGAWAQAA